MAAFNKVILVGRLTRDPECKTFANGGKVAKFGFAVTNRRKNSQTGQWEDEPMFIDCEAFNRGENGTLANIIEQYCHKGSQILIEGSLHLDTWDDKTTGQKRQKHKLVVNQMQLLDGKPQAQHAAPQNNSGGSASTADEPDAEPTAAGEREIPF